MQQIRWDEHPFIKYQRLLNPLMLTEQGLIIKCKLPKFNSGRGTTVAKVDTQVIYDRDYVIAKLHNTLKPILKMDSSDIHDLISEAIELEKNEQLWVSGQTRSN